MYGHCVSSWFTLITAAAAAAAFNVLFFSQVSLKSQEEPLQIVGTQSFIGWKPFLSQLTALKH